MSKNTTNTEFEIRGLNHVAMVCKDMARTVDFYTNVLGMKLAKTIDLPGGVGQHFFFDIGGGQCFAFFWFTEAQERMPGISNPRENINPEVIFRDPTAITSSHGSMNHFAFDVAPEKIEEYHHKLLAKGVEVSSIMNHDNSPTQDADEVTEDVWVRSIYFQDPDGIVLEFAAWQRAFNPKHGDRSDHVPATPADKNKYREAGRAFIAEMAETAAG
jgi:catechol 2,3-dioxygenase-like lactoylglutathione lyase family enzyme